MNCAYHTDTENTAFCIKCGKPLCAQCVRQVQSSIYCESCLADSLGGNAAPPPLPQIAGGASSEAAFVLGLIPGVGAIYNAQYFKAAIHLLVFATLVNLTDPVGNRGETIFSFLAFGFYVYMPFEAYYTAKKRKLAREGINLITPLDHFAEQIGQFGNLELLGGIALVLIGGLFLLDNFDIVRMEQIGKFWPALLILAGAALIWRFQRGKKA